MAATPASPFLYIINLCIIKKILFHKFMYYYKVTTGPSLRREDRHTVTHSNTGHLPIGACQPATDLSNVATFGGSLGLSCFLLRFIKPRYFTLGRITTSQKLRSPTLLPASLTLFLLPLLAVQAANFAPCKFGQPC